MTLKKDGLRSWTIRTISRILLATRRHLICKLFGLLVVLLIPTTSFSITIVKKVGHGDCYVVISDGRVVVIDVGPQSSLNGLVSLLRTGYRHFDRIVITHVHSDHVGGFITAERYAKQEGAAFSTDMLVSNHGEHDLTLIVRESKIGPLQALLRKRLVALNDEAIAKLELNSEHLEVRAIALGTGGEGNENKSGLILKVTEIRDGIRRATLFLGDIEQAQQKELFSRLDAMEIFRDVGAITLPHHGRPRTLLTNFFSELKKVSTNDIVVLHSDATPLNHEVAKKAEEAGLKVKSTADPGSKGAEVIINLFQEKTHYQVGKQPTTLSAIVEKAHTDFIERSGSTREEVAEAVGKYSNRLMSALLQPGDIVSRPTEKWLADEIRRQRETVELSISQLKSGQAEQVTIAQSTLSDRVYKLNERQIRRINEVSPGAIEKWEAEHATIAEREIQKGLARGWVVASTNIDEDKFFIQTKGRNDDTPGISKYIVKDGPNNTWHIFALGQKNSKGITAYGKPLGIMRKPAGAETAYYELCEYCGRPAVGLCHIRDKYVCERHRYFTQGGVNWQCP